MRVFAISDLHLSGEVKKPMDIFGAHWSGHWERIKESWRELVSEEDLVLIPGDISWAMKLTEAAPSIEEICSLPGTKVLLRGNHDYWWGSLSQVRALLSHNTYVLQNDCLVVGDTAVIGSRGWTFCGGTANDKKIFDREVQRLALSADALKKKQGVRRVIGMMHYPPFNEKAEPSEFTEIFRTAGATDVVYGHLHGEGLKYCTAVVELDGTSYHLTSCDFLGFKLKEII